MKVGAYPDGCGASPARSIGEAGRLRSRKPDKHERRLASGSVTGETTAHRDSSEFDLRHFLHILRRRRWTILATAVAVVTAVLAAVLVQTPTYQATAEVVFQANNASRVFNNINSLILDPSRDIQTQLEVVKSPSVRSAVAKALNLSQAPPVSATAVTGTNALKILATSPLPRRAADTANAYARAFITFSQQQALDYLNSVANQMQTQIAGLQGQIDALDRQVTTAPSSQQAATLARLSPQRAALSNELVSDQESLNQVQAQISAPGGASVLVTPAVVPSTPSSPKPAADAVLGLIIGLLFGVILALVLDYLNDSIRSKEDMERSSRGLPVLAMIPAVRNWKQADGPFLASVDAPTSAAAEAYRTLRAGLQFLDGETPLSVIQVTSPIAGEGKTTTVANLGVALANAGQRVCVCCCDFRRPRLNEFFRLRLEPGMTSVLGGDVPLSAAIQRSTEVPNLSVLPAGPLVDNPSEVLSSSRAGDLVRALRQKFDVVLLDSAPVLPVADAMEVSRFVDATIVVVRVGQTTRRGLSRTLELLRSVEAPVIGTVLNGVVAEADYGYGDDYFLYYKTPPPNGNVPNRQNGGRRRDSASDAAYR